MYIHVDYKDYTHKCGEYFEEYVRFDSKDKMNTLSRMIDYIYAYMKNHNEYDKDVIQRCNLIKDHYHNYTIHKGTWVKWIINDSNVQTGIKMIEWCMNWIKSNKIKDIKVVNKCWHIRCFSGYWRKDFKCQGA